ncbi:MFS transporter [Caballeronia sp. LZ001]|uniref:MFS transporter n=1 Tax=Caballeronia sp. LZ001 TaxID=3038553 RepID=UPI002855E33C|nr:MFS transporter [Caballeronia sp. LZ001]MDR5804869.1 MFS transporter [Caballeronia sp. LZ001]
MATIDRQDVVLSLSPYRWVVLALAWVAMFMTYLCRLAWANVASVASEAFHLPIAALGGFVTAFFVGYVLANAINGFAADRFGVRFILPGAVFSLGVLTYMFGAVKSVPSGMVIQCLMGLAAGIDFSTAIKIVSAWFPPENRGRAVGIVSTGSPTGIVVANMLFPEMLLHLEWDSLYRVVGGATVIFSLVCLLLVRDAPSKLVATDAGCGAQAFIAFLRDRNFWIVSLAGFGGNWALVGFLFWTNALLHKQLGFTLVQAGTVAAVYGVAAIAGPPVVGTCSDWLGRPRKWLAGGVFLVMTLGLAVFGGLAALPPMWVVAAILGFTSFGWIALIVTIMTELVGVEFAASAVGLSTAITQISAVIMPVAVGIVFHETSSFFLSFISLAAGPLLSSALILTVREGPIQRFR